MSLDGNMAFGTIAVGSFVQATLRISNSGSEPLNVTGMTFPDAGVYSYSWTSGSIAAGSSQTATIRFTPADTSTRHIVRRRHATRRRSGH